MIGAAGTDLYADAETGDTVIAENHEVFEANGATFNRVEIDYSAGLAAVSVDPSSRDNFNQRVQDDLQTMRSLESGQAMLNALDAEFNTRGHSTVIQEFDADNGRAAAASFSDIFMEADGTTRGAGSSTVISYNPHYNTSSNATPKVPIAVLFHELAHAYTFATGTGINGDPDYVAPNPTDPNNGTRLLELAAAGIYIDHDNDPTTPDQLPNEAAHPFELTENGIREELGLPNRDVY